MTKRMTIMKRWAPAMAILVIISAITAGALMLAAQPGTLSANQGIPAAPTEPMAHLIIPDQDDPRIRVSWDPPPDGESVTGYTVRRSDGRTFDGAGTATTHSDAEIQPGQSYTYTVKARNGSGASPPSETASATVPATPSEPAELTHQVDKPGAADTAPRVTLSWEAATAPEAADCETAYPVTAYVVTRSGGTGGDETFNLGPDALEFTDDGAEFGAEYTYSVAARSRIGAGPEATTNLTTPHRPVGAPTGLTAAISQEAFDGTVSLSWTAPEPGEHVTGYRVRRSENGETAGELASNHQGTSYDDDTAVAGVTYSYTVRSEAGEALSADSAPAAMEVPAPVSNVTARLEDNGVNLSWDAPAPGNAGTYRVARQEQDAPWSNLADVTTTGHVDGNPLAGRTYVYRVQNRNNHGGSAWTLSNPVDVIAMPDTPSGLSVTQDGMDNVLSWTEATAATVDGYRLRHSVGDGAWANIMDRAGRGDLTFRHENAATDVEHYYAVQSYNAAGNSEWSESVSTIRVTPPDTPANLAAVVDNVDIVFSWNRPDTVFLDHYEVEYTVNGGDANTHSLTEGETSYRVSDAVDRATYAFRVRASNTGGDSPWSAEVSAAVIRAPSVPRNVSAVAGTHDITVTWHAPEVGTPDGYRVRHAAGEATNWGTPQDAGNATNYTHSSPVEGTTYWYSIQAHNSTGDSEWSEPVEAERLNPPPMPRNVSSDVENEDIVIRWEAPATGVVDDYTVSHGEQNAGEPVEEKVTDGSNTFRHTGNTAGTTYEYQVRSNNSRGSSEWTEPVTAVRVERTGAPTGVAAEAIGQAIELSWTTPDGEIDRYQVRHGLVDGDWEEPPVDVDAGATSWVHTAALGNTRYRYQVRTENDAGAGSWSETVEAIWVIPPQVPTGLAAVIDGESLLLSWTPPAQGGLVGRYEIEHRAQGDHDWADPWFADSGLASHVHADPVPAQTYQYRIRSKNDGGVSEWSEIAEGTWYEELAPPTHLRARTLGERLFVRWQPTPSLDATGYDLRHRFDEGEWSTSALTPRGRSGQLLGAPPEGTESVEFSIRTVRNDVQGEWTPAVRYDLVAPGPVRNLRVRPEGLSSVRIHWDEPETGTVGFYHVGNTSSHRTLAADVRSRRMSAVHGQKATYDASAMNGLRIAGPEVSLDHRIRTAEGLSEHRERVTGPDVEMLDGQTVKLTWEHPTGDHWPWNTMNWVITRDVVTQDNLNPGAPPPIIAYVKNGTSYIDTKVEPSRIYRYRVTWDWPYNYQTRRSASVYAATWD